MTTGDLVSRFAAMGQALAKRPHLARLGALFSETVLVEVDDPALFVAAVLRVEPAPPPLALSFFVVGVVLLEGWFVMAVLLTGNRRAPWRRPRSRRLRCRPGRRAYSKCDGDNLSQFSASVADGSANV